ncbi:hypothetical protein CLI71_07005 [Prevotella intermedia]|uniref:Uncharacterized protein n=2 Tax=Prevotella intermedia TaxID=28131 RepID=A0A2A6EET1_PREIN|nr:hypothetical protein CLI71_07005 [Prevotella intermedia]
MASETGLSRGGSSPPTPTKIQIRHNIKNKRMKIINATIKNAEIRTSERFSDAVDIALEIITEEIKTVNLIVVGNCRKDSGKNEIGYSVSRIMDICEVDSFLEVENSPIRAIFENERLIGICGFFDKENKFIPSEEL